VPLAVAGRDLRATACEEAAAAEEE